MNHSVTMAAASTGFATPNIHGQTPRVGLWQHGKPEVGLLICLTVPILASLASLKEITFGGLNYLLAISIGLPAVLMAVMLVKAGLAPDRLRTWTGHRRWLAWYGLIWCSLVWGVVRDGGAFKHAFEMCTPYLFAFAGAMFIRNETQLRWLLNSVLLSVLTSIACVVVWKIGFIDAGDFSSGPALDPRPHSMSLLPIAALAIALMPSQWILSLGLWSVCLILSGIEGSRGVTLCLLVLPLFHPGFRGWRWRLLMAGFVMAMGLIVFYLPPMQARLFPDSGSGHLVDLLRSKQSGMGRFEAWPQVLERTFESPIVGHGVSSVFHYVPTIWDRMRSPHNELLCIGYEFGAVGLAIYALVMASQIWIVRRSIGQSTPLRRLALSTVYLSLIAFNIMALTDNPLSSNVRFLNPVFLVMGAALAIHARPNHSHSSPVEPVV